MAWLFGMTALVMPLAGPAQAQEPSRQQALDRQGSGHTPDPRAAFASFEGRTIDLGRDWGDARACLVWRQGGISECFRTEQALDAREAQLAPRREATTATSAATSTATAYYSYSCSSSLRLYEYNWYGGRRLSFWDRGWWQNLSDYGFEDRTSSYIVGACPVWLAEHADGGGAWYDGPTYPYAGEPGMPWYWQDRISSIYVG